MLGLRWCPCNGSRGTRTRLFCRENDHRDFFQLSWHLAQQNGFSHKDFCFPLCPQTCSLKKKLGLKWCPCTGSRGTRTLLFYIENDRRHLFQLSWYLAQQNSVFKNDFFPFLPSNLWFIEKNAIWSGVPALAREAPGPWHFVEKVMTEICFGEGQVGVNMFLQFWYTVLT